MLSLATGIIGGGDFERVLESCWTPFEGSEEGVGDMDSELGISSSCMPFLKTSDAFLDPSHVVISTLAMILWGGM